MNMRLLTVFLIVMIDLIGFGIILPLLPFYAKQFQVSNLSIGLLYSVYSFCQLIFSPLWGSLSDRLGRRPIMLLSTFGSSIAYILFAFAPSLGWLFFSRLLAGIMGGNIATAQAYVADVTSSKERARGMGLIGAAFGIGFMLGPALAAIVTQPSLVTWLSHAPSTTLNWLGAHVYALPGFVAAALSCVSFILVCFKLPETVSPQMHASQDRVSIFSGVFWKRVFPGGAGSSILSLLLICVFLLSFGQANLYSAFPLYCLDVHALSASQVGFLFAYMGLIAIIIQGGFIRRLTHLFSEERLFLVGCVLMVIGLALIPFSGTLWLLLGALTLMSIGGSLNGPTLFSLTSKQASQRRYGQTMGLSQGMSGLGRVIGPSWGGFLFNFAFYVPFVVTSAIVAVTIGVGLKLNRVSNQNSS